MSWMIAGMAAVGLATNYMNQKSQSANNEKQAKMAAAQQQYSPWTGIKAEAPQLKPTDEVGGALTGAAQGALSGAMYNNAQAQNANKTPQQPGPSMAPTDQSKATLYDQAVQQKNGPYGEYLQNMGPGQRRS